MHILKTAPAVFAVGQVYQIFVPVRCECVMWVRVGSNRYYDDANGVLRSRCRVHRMTVPMEELDAAGVYTICCRNVLVRQAYDPVTGELAEYAFPFYPVKGNTFTAYQIADTYDHIEPAVGMVRRFAREYGEPDLLILNGDLICECDSEDVFDTIYEIAAQVTGGSKPILYARGNHDPRGIYGEALSDYTPTDNGKPYFTFRLGNLWGLVLDCGEDKADENIEYGHTICCAPYRQQQSRFLEQLADRAAEEYGAPGVTHRIVVVHAPFTQKSSPPFDIEEETYRYWAKLLKIIVKPQLMLCGHTHKQTFDLPGGQRDALGQPCPVAVCSGVNKAYDHFSGGGILFRNNGSSVIFNDLENITEQYDLIYDQTARLF